MRERNLLVLDDNVMLLKAMEKYFKLEEINCYTAGDAETAFKIINEKNISVILSDYQMPDINGIEFLTKIQEEHPEIIRILYSGSIDEKVIAQFLESGSIWRYIKKPFNVFDIGPIINQAFEQYELQDKS